jgi:NADH-quinone oxidoreductase subunit L
VFAALLTSFYSWRLMFLTFFGKARWAGSEHVQHALHGEHEDPGDENSPHEAEPEMKAAPAGTGGYRPHESPWTMLVPLALLSLGAVAAGMVFHHALIDVEEGAHFWAGSLAFDAHLMHEIHEVPLWVKLSPAVAMLIGLSIAWNAYIRDPSVPARFTAHFGLLHTFLWHKWYFDELYDLVFVRPSLWLGGLLWKRGDEGMIDRFGPDGAAAAVFAGTRLTSRIQTGYLYTYALVMLLGLAAAMTWAMAR